MEVCDLYAVAKYIGGETAGTTSTCQSHADYYRVVAPRYGGGDGMVTGKVSVMVLAAFGGPSDSGLVTTTVSVPEPPAAAPAKEAVMFVGSTYGLGPIS